MKIVYFYQYFGTPKGSWSTRVYELTRRWVKAGDSVTVVTSTYDKSDLKPTKFIERYTIEGVDVRLINVRQSNKHGKWRRILTFGTYALIACWYALARKADVVIASSGPITVGLPGLCARYLRRTPMVFEVRDLWPEGAIQLGIIRNRLFIWLARRFERRCYRAAQRIVTLSDGQADWIRQRYGIDKIDVIPNASDNELIDRLGKEFQMPAWAEGKKLVLYTGTLGLIDDCSQILDVAKVLQTEQAKDIALVIVGDGKERCMLEQAAERLQLSNVHFMGLVSKERAMQWLGVASCSLFVVKDVPFLATASPNKLFDAFAVGLPVVQATTGWIHDLFEREMCGVNVPPNDAKAMADAINRLIGDGQYHAMISANARRVAEEIFDRDLLANEMRRILASCVGKTP